MLLPKLSKRSLDAQFVELIFLAIFQKIGFQSFYLFFYIWLLERPRLIILELDRSIFLKIATKTSFLKNMLSFKKNYY